MTFTCSVCLRRFVVAGRFISDPFIDWKCFASTEVKIES